MIWSSETLKSELPRLVEPYDPARIICASYELSMGNEAWVTHDNDPQTRVRVNLDRDERVNIPAGQFALLLVDEIVEIPRRAIGLISIKSAVKVRGLINVSGFHVDPGYRGRLVFGVFNAGSKPITIGQGEPTFLLWYVSLDRPTDNVYSGSRQDVLHITDEQVMNLKGPTFNPTALADRVTKLENHHNWWRTIALSISAGLILLVVGFILGEWI